MATLVRMKAHAARLAHEDEVAMGGAYSDCRSMTWGQVSALLKPALAAMESNFETSVDDAAGIARTCARTINKLQQCSWEPEDEGPVKFLIAGCACLWLATVQLSPSPAHGKLLTLIINGIVKQEKPSMRSVISASSQHATVLVAAVQSLLISQLGWGPQVCHGPSILSIHLIDLHSMTSSYASMNGQVSLLSSYTWN